MGCGKSTIGEKLHIECKLPFIDTDHFIEETEQTSIKELFLTKGEEYFREQETTLLRALTTEPTAKNLIISTGGGIVLRPQNRTLLRNLGFVVWLKVDAETIYQRIQRNKERPLLQTENPLETLQKIEASRRFLYKETAHLIIETAPLTAEETTFGIIESARHYFSNY